MLLDVARSRCCSSVAKMCLLLLDVARCCSNVVKSCATIARCC